MWGTMEGYLKTNKGYDRGSIFLYRHRDREIGDIRR